MEEIKVGEYVRDEEGYLGKCTSKYGESVVLTMQNGEIIGTREYEKYKHSSSITDLVEERRLCEWI